MPQSATITVLDKQRVSDKAKAPYKIEASTGDIYKAWPDVGQNIHAGETYNISYEIRVTGEYSDRFIKVANKSTEKPTAAASPPGQFGSVTKAPVVDWAAKEEDMATLAMFKAVYGAASTGSDVDVAQCLDQCRMEWRAHKARTGPKGKPAPASVTAPPPRGINEFLGPEGDVEEF